MDAGPLKVVDLIVRKRNGHRLDTAEISQLVAEFSSGAVPDYQLSALAMAIYFQGMDRSETVALTQAMTASGQILQWRADDRPVIDKHSTGGIGDKTSLVLVPLLACFEVLVPKLSGRGLGTTGGTLDKLEAIPGFKVDYSIADFQRLVRDVGCAIVSASQELAPADKKLYALRDVTGTVDSIPLITASILSKKLAEGLDALVLDVKCGAGALMKDRSTSHALATSLVDVAATLGTPAVALLSDMNRPLGTMVGNACEILEAVENLQGNSTGPLHTLVVELACELLVAAGQFDDRESARGQVSDKLTSGAALDKFFEMVHAQGGQWPCDLELAPPTEWTAPESGWVESLDAQAIGQLVMGLGGGRQKVTDRIDHGVGAEILVRVGQSIERHEPWIRIFTRRALTPGEIELVQGALRLSLTPREPTPLILDRIASPVVAE